jgi:outer membrane protein OmpA-like peptidoglycan-associated protein
MCVVRSSRLNRIAIAASVAMLLSGTAFAQTVQVFDEVPSIEQLRSIMVPETRPGASRSIVIQRPDTSAEPASIQHASTRVSPAPRTSIASDTASGSARHRLPAQEAAIQPGAVAFHVNFAFNSAQLPDTARSMIDLMAQLMKEAPDVKVRVEGHTDAIGAADYNVALSERRALSVGEYLVKQGVEPSRLLLIGKGMAEPLTHNRYDPANRRVQFVRVG